MRLVLDLVDSLGVVLELVLVALGRRAGLADRSLFVECFHVRVEVALQVVAFREPFAACLALVPFLPRVR